MWFGLPCGHGEELAVTQSPTGGFRAIAICVGLMGMVHSLNAMSITVDDEFSERGLQEVVRSHSMAEMH